MKKLILNILSLFLLASPFHLQAEDALELMQQEIKHVVILMLENRSFDNLAAWLYDEDHPPAHFIPHHTDPHYLGLSDALLDQYTNHLKNSSGEIVYSCPPIKGIPSANSTPFVNSPKFDPNEPFPHVQMQIFGDMESTQPTMLGFLQDYATLWNENEWEEQKNDICAVMETYTDKELTVFNNLARHYAISDYWFSSVPTQTNPNRAFAFCGTSEGEIVNGPLGKNIFFSDTIWNRLDEHSPDTTWTIFWQSGLLPGIYETPYSGPMQFTRLADIRNHVDHFQKLDKFHELAAAGQLPDISFIEPQWTLSMNLSLTDKKKMGSSFRGDELILGLQGNDYHPPGDLRTGENFLANVYTSLIANPQAWANTLLIVTFDEHGGLFDHIPPPAAISPDDFCQHGFHFDRYGVRVPTILISPKINKGVVFRSEHNNIPFDHTSLIATLLKWKNIDQRKWNMGRRVESAPTFEAVFERLDPRNDPVLCEDQSILPQDEDGILRMGDLFYLKDSDGNYLCEDEVKHFLGLIPYLTKTKALLTFDGNYGAAMHGSFVLIKSADSTRGSHNILQTSCDHFLCSFGDNTHNSNQWWTLKSVDHPYVGSKIRYGQKIYLENHLYFDLIQYVPCRLTKNDHHHIDQLRTEPIVNDGCEKLYWTIEKL